MESLPTDDNIHQGLHAAERPKGQDDITLLHIVSDEKVHIHQGENDEEWRML